MPALIHYLSNSQNANHWTNFGPNERALTEKLEHMTDATCICVANATVALEILHKIMLKTYKQVFLPAFTFPATNASVPIECRNWILPIVKGEFIGHTPRVLMADEYTHCYQVITIPFGDPICEQNYGEFIPLIVDAAAGASPDMALVKHWLHKEKALAVVVSLHATKLWPAGEGGFVAFRYKGQAELFKSYSNFGINIVGGERVYNLDHGTNGKMSDLAAAAALANYNVFASDFKRRTEFSNRLAVICKEKQIDCIASAQSFWMFSPCDTTETIKWFKKEQIDVRAYYWDTPCTPGGILTEYGICLPVWPEDKNTQNFIAQKLERFLNEHSCNW